MATGIFALNIKVLRFAVDNRVEAPKNGGINP